MPKTTPKPKTKPPVTDPSWEKYLSFRCTGCGNCCRGTRILVSDVDLRRIVEGTGRKVTDFVKFIGHDDLAMDKSHGYWVKLDVGRRVMVLKWRTGGACTFLDTKNMCGVYEYRPTVCHMHPFEVTKGETGAIERLRLSRLVPCPHEWDGKVSKRQLSATDRQLEVEGIPYCDKVEAWNKQKGVRKTPRGFLRYLGFDA